MAYETGSSTGTADLVSKITTFAQGNGWTHTNVSGGFVLSKDGSYFAIAYDSSNVYVRGCTGINAGSAWDAQPGSAGLTAATNGLAGSQKAYHFFAGTHYLYCVIEASTNIFRHIVMGRLTKYGTYTGGDFFSGTSWGASDNNPDSGYSCVPFDAIGYSNTNYIRADIDGNTNKWWRFGDASSSTAEARSVVRSYTGIMTSLYWRSVNHFNQRTILIPIEVDILRGSGLYSPVGQATDMRFVSMTNYNPGQVVTIGSDEWMVFPLVQKTNTWNNSNSSIPSSGYHGFAYRKTP